MERYKIYCVFFCVLIGGFLLSQSGFSSPKQVRNTKTTGLKKNNLECSGRFPTGLFGERSLQKKRHYLEAYLTLESTLSSPAFSERKEERDMMVSVIRSYGFEDSGVLLAISRVPRHEFVPENLQNEAYADSPLPIGYGQTISQPFIVAEMTRLLKLDGNSRVLEVGTGSGYQAAILAQFTPNVYSIEIIKPLADEAKARLKRLGLDMVHVRQGDGYYGWSENAPFDGIVVTAAAGEIPPPLIEQLRNGGRMVIPVGPVFGVQSLMLVEKDESGKVRTRSLMAVRFVPLTREDRNRH